MPKNVSGWVGMYCFFLQYLSHYGGIVVDTDVDYCTCDVWTVQYFISYWRKLVQLNLLYTAKDHRVCSQ